MTNEKCPLCGGRASKKMMNDENVKYVGMFFNCDVCGRYGLTADELEARTIDWDKLRIFLYYNGFRATEKNWPEYRYYSSLPKEKCDAYNLEFKKGINEHGCPVHMDKDTVDAWYPRSLSEKTDMILLKLDKIAEYIGQEVVFSRLELYGLMFVKRYKTEKDEFSEEEMDSQANFFIEYLKEAGYIKGGKISLDNTETYISITPKGYKQIDYLNRNSGDGRNVLVAMKFDAETVVLREAVKKGIIEAGYNPVLIDEVEHNNLITPELLSQIRNSRFVVVDLSHRNNGAYFEEGYAMGLGKPVIQLCKKGVNLHFDIAQVNTIIWDKESDIPSRLKNRIMATID